MLRSHFDSASGGYPLREKVAGRPAEADNPEHHHDDKPDSWFEIAKPTLSIRRGERHHALQAVDKILLSFFPHGELRSHLESATCADALKMSYYADGSLLSRDAAGRRQPSWDIFEKSRALIRLPAPMRQTAAGRTRLESGALESGPALTFETPYNCKSCITRTPRAGFRMNLFHASARPAPLRSTAGIML